MRKARIVEEGGGFYHVVTRVIERKYVFDESGREWVRNLLKDVAGFSAVEILTYCVMSNHLHILLYVPPREEVMDDELERRLARLYGSEKAGSIMGYIQYALKEGWEPIAEMQREKYVRRMYDLGQFMKTLKQRLTQGYNREQGRKGTLWEERYKSVVVEGEPGTLLKVAAYIDLNPVRAGMVRDPADYRHSGYGEAMGGVKSAREGLKLVMAGMGLAEWGEMSAEYRKMLYVKGMELKDEGSGEVIRAGIRTVEVDQVIGSDGKLTIPELLLLRVRYFTDGAILGSRKFVDEAFGRHRVHFGARRKTGARKLNGVDLGELFAARDLREDVVSCPAPA